MALLTNRFRVVQRGSNNSWKLYRDMTGEPLAFSTREEAQAAIDLMTRHGFPSRFRVHEGGLSNGKLGGRND